MALLKFKSRGNISRESIYFNNPNASWTPRKFDRFADEAYIKNVIAHRSICMIAQAAASVPFKLYRLSTKGKSPVAKHRILELLNSPNPTQSGKEFLESVYTYRQIAGNAYIMATGVTSPLELYSLRPDRVTIIGGDNFLPASYEYKTQEKTYNFKVNQITGLCKILHIKNFHPLSDWYGLSSIEAAAYSIDQHNMAGKWNQSLLQNGARPSGAIVVNKDNHLTVSQFDQLKSMIDEIFSGPNNAGRPMVLEGGLDWKEMAMSPKDMDFIESKHSSARDIALALGVPPQLLGIPGDNTYSNLQEARLAFWEQTIIPLVDNVTNDLNQWMQLYFNEDFELGYDINKVSALAGRQEILWQRLQNCDFMTINEKREAVGLGPIVDGNSLSAAKSS